MEHLLRRDILGDTGKTPGKEDTLVARGHSLRVGCNVSGTRSSKKMGSSRSDIGSIPGAASCSKRARGLGTPLAATAETTLPTTSAIEHGTDASGNGSRMTFPCFWRFVPSSKSGLSPRKVCNDVISRVKCKRDIRFVKW
jgi:hypothetical protein